MTNEATDLSSHILRTTEVRSGGFFRKVSGQQSGSPHQSSDKKHSASARHSSTVKSNYESTYRGLESLTLGNK